MITLMYKESLGVALKIDVYPPSITSCDSRDEGRGGLPIHDAPAILLFHGGGLTVGSRTSWFPHWMKKRFTERGCLFISADYRLIPPSTGHEIVEDIQDLWAFLRNPDLIFDFTAPAGSSKFRTETTKVRVQPGAVAVAGVSAGGLCAYLAAIHCRNPPPRAVLSLYGMGGDLLTAHYLTPKTRPFFRGRELLSATDPTLRPFVFPYSQSPGGSLRQTSDSPLSYNPADHPTKPGYPSNPRMLLARLYLQLGEYLDYYTGEHEPSLSMRLSEGIGKGAGLDEIATVIGEKNLGLFPQFSLREGKHEKWPPTALVHGTDDTAVPIQESRNLYSLLRSARRHHGKGQDAESKKTEDLLVEIPGAEHSFDLTPDAEEKYSGIFDRVGDFIHRAVVGSCED